MSARPCRSIGNTGKNFAPVIDRPAGTALPPTYRLRQGFFPYVFAGQSSFVPDALEAKEGNPAANVVHTLIEFHICSSLTSLHLKRFLFKVNRLRMLCEGSFPFDSNRSIMALISSFGLGSRLIVLRKVSA